jgi:hypothetical protein
MAVSGTPATDMLTGDCLPNRPFEAFAHDPDFSRPFPQSLAYGTASGTGHISVDMSNAAFPNFNLMAGDDVQIMCLLITGTVP